jgi:predicted DNA-binding transcriptional regulator AlpA
MQRTKMGLGPGRQDETQFNDSPLLSGKKAIIEYCGRSWPTIQRWIKERSFPACKMDGVWESDKELVKEWRRRQIKDEGASRSTT